MGGTVDTGITLTLIATDAFRTYRAVTGAIQGTNGLLKLSDDKFANAQSTLFTNNEIRHPALVLTNREQATYEYPTIVQSWPRSLNAATGGAQQTMCI